MRPQASPADARARRAARRRPGTHRAPWVRLLPAAAGLLLWAVLPLLVKGRLSLSIFIFIALYAAITAGLSLLAGYAGQVSLGQAAFYGLGAYITGILTASAGWSPWLGIPAAVAGTAGLAYLLGAPILKLRGHYLVVATLGLNVVIDVVLRQWHSLTGGPSGLGGIPPLALGGVRLAGDGFYYYAAGLLAMAAMGLSRNLVRSRFGRALQAIHASETAAETLAVDPARYKAQVFVWSAALAGAAGALYAHYLAFVSPSPFGFTFSVELLMMTVVGGIASIPGAAVGAALAVLLREQLRDVMPALMGYASAEYEIVVFGVLLAAVAIFAPEGFWPRLVRRLRRWLPPDAAPAGGPTGGGSGTPTPSGPEPLELPPADVGAPPLRVERVSRRFGGLVAVSDLSLEVLPGEILAIIGPNGAGKTTLFNVISGVLKPSGGRIFFEGRRIDGLPAHQIAALGIARTFQTPRLFPLLSALENVMVGLHRHLRAGFLRSLLGLTRAEEETAAARALAALDLVGAGALAGEAVGALPFGAHRQVELARALASRPRLLLLDEPGSGLSAAEKRELAELVRKIRSSGVAVILVEHDIPFVMELADRVLVMHHGEAIAQGDPATVRADPRVIAAYLGAADRGGAAPPEEPVPAGAPAPADAPAGTPAPAGMPAGPRRPALAVRGLVAGYGPIQVLRGVDFEAYDGELVAILGPNGAGKTTLMSAVAGLLPARGTVEFDGRSILGQPAERIAGLGLVLVPERRQLLPSMTVRDHLVLGAFTRTHRRRVPPRRAGAPAEGGSPTGGGSPGSGSPAAVRRDLEMVYDLFPMLREKLHQPARMLSGGQQQMLAIARALMARPRALLLDEPLLGLAPRVIEDILGTIARMRGDGLAVVLVEQNAAAVLPIADRAYVLDGGRFALAGPARRLLEAPELEAVFLGGSVRGGGAGS